MRMSDACFLDASSVVVRYSGQMDYMSDLIKHDADLDANGKLLQPVMESTVLLRFGRMYQSS